MNKGSKKGEGDGEAMAKSEVTVLPRPTASHLHRAPMPPCLPCSLWSRSKVAVTSSCLTPLHRPPPPHPSPSPPTLRPPLLSHLLCTFLITFPSPCDLHHFSIFSAPSLSPSHLPAPSPPSLPGATTYLLQEDMVASSASQLLRVLLSALRAECAAPTTDTSTASATTAATTATTSVDPTAATTIGSGPEPAAPDSGASVAEGAAVMAWEDWWLPDLLQALYSGEGQTKRGRGK